MNQFMEQLFHLRQKKKISPMQFIIPKCTTTPIKMQFMPVTDNHPSPPPQTPPSLRPLCHLLWDNCNVQMVLVWLTSACAANTRTVFFHSQREFSRYSPGQSSSPRSCIKGVQSPVAWSEGPEGGGGDGLTGSRVDAAAPYFPLM